jgi:hypothetical protein
MSSRHPAFAGLLGALLIAGTTRAQPPAAPASPVYASAGQQPVAAGRVARLLINPNGDIDGLLLDDGTQVQTKPHLSNAVAQSIHDGDEVSVEGFRGYGVPVVHALVITDRASGRSVVEQPPAPGPRPPAGAALAALSASGRVAHLLYTDRGDLDGALLDDGSIVRWPPHLAAQFQSTLRAGSTLAASGYGTQNAYGRALQASSLSIDGGAAIALYGRRP